MASHPTRMHVSTDKLLVRCVTGKVDYTTREEALDHAELQMLAGKVNPGCHLTPYLCKECGRYHVGNRTIVHVA